MRWLGSPWVQPPQLSWPCGRANRETELTSEASNPNSAVTNYITTVYIILHLKPQFPHLQNVKKHTYTSNKSGNKYKKHFVNNKYCKSVSVFTVNCQILQVSLFGTHSFALSLPSFPSPFLSVHLSSMSCCCSRSFRYYTKAIATVEPWTAQAWTARSTYMWIFFW